MKRSLMVAVCLVTAATWASAHCDTLDGPVVVTAREALDKGDVTPVLKWIGKDAEAEIREAFQKALAVRKQGTEAKELADRYFFETLVRIHRAGEGAPFTGLKPAGTAEPAATAADQALAKGNADELAKQVSAAVAAGIRQRFERVRAAKKHAEHGVEAGREYVAAYVEYVHYVERMQANAGDGGTAHHHEQ